MTLSEVVSISGHSPFQISTSNGTKYVAKNIVLTSGSNAESGVDSTYLLKSYGHTPTEFYPSLVPLATDIQYLKGLKGVRIDAGATLYIDGIGVKTAYGEIIFKDNGLTGTLIFELSTALARSKKRDNVEIGIDFLPHIDNDNLSQVLSIGLEGLFHKEIVNNLKKRSVNDDIRHLVKSYIVKVKGAQSKDLAQVMSGGFNLGEFDISTLQSKKEKCIYAAGEVLDVDGDCGGFNLMWAFASGLTVGYNMEWE
jgi:predicted flavoprotein YhiN